VPHFSSAWRSVALRHLLEATTKTPTIIENDVNLAAIGESWLGVARGVRDFVFMSVDKGVGAGIFVNGNLYHGPDWASGEVGFLYLPGSGKGPLAAGRLGPLEKIVCPSRIERSWRKLLGRNQGSKHKSTRHATATEIFSFAEKGDLQARRLLKQTSQMLAYAVSNICVVLNCSLVVFGGCIGSNPLVFETVRRILERNDFPRPRLALSILGEDATLRGAIWLALSAAERIILPSSIRASFSPRDVSGVLQPFLGIAPPKQSRNV